MKRIVKWLIPCLVACFMGLGLVQNQAQIKAAESYTIEAGQTQEITGGGKLALRHSWTSSDSSKVTVQGYGSSATITGIDQTYEPVEITHTWWSGSETFYVQVTKSAYVYLYTKVVGDTTGLTINKDGWYTIGKVKVDESAIQLVQQIIMIKKVKRTML